jgi:LPXTG-site transpeptidase (sortase) family protein
LGRTLRVVGTLCLFGAVGMAAYIGWVQWGTGFLAARSQDRLRAELEQRIHRPSPGDVRVSVAGDAIGILRIPKISLDMVVVEGTSVGDLKKGPGHYGRTAYPWQRTGRVGIAGHRTTYLHPFWNLDQLKAGDRIRLITEYGSFDYRVTHSRVVRPSAGWVLRSTARPTLVLTACTPRFSAAQRLVVFADRVAGPATGPSVRVLGATAVDVVGPSDDVVRPMLLWLAVSFAVGAFYLAVRAARRRSPRAI